MCCAWENSAGWQDQAPFWSFLSWTRSPTGSTTSQAQAERERQARVILGESEMQIAHSFADASQAYINNPTALHLRAMNMLFEGLKEKGALVIVPSSAVDTMNLGGISGMLALRETAKAALPEE